MGRLIDVDANREDFKKIVYRTLNDCGATAKEKFNLIMTAFDNIPTAYDVDKVVEEIMTLYEEGHCQNEDDYDCVLNKTCSDCYREQLTEILRKGGVNENS